jgi:hypothetical protein
MNRQMEELAHGERVIGQRNAFVLRHNPIKICVHPADNLTVGWNNPLPAARFGQIFGEACFTEPVPLIAQHVPSTPLNLLHFATHCANFGSMFESRIINNYS